MRTPRLTSLIVFASVAPLAFLPACKPSGALIDFGGNFDLPVALEPQAGGGYSLAENETQASGEGAAQTQQAQTTQTSAQTTTEDPYKAWPGYGGEWTRNERTDTYQRYVNGTWYTSKVDPSNASGPVSISQWEGGTKVGDKWQFKPSDMFLQNKVDGQVQYFKSKDFNPKDYWDYENQKWLPKENKQATRILAEQLYQYRETPQDKIVATKAEDYWAFRKSGTNVSAGGAQQAQSPWTTPNSQALGWVQLLLRNGNQGQQRQRNNGGWQSGQGKGGQQRTGGAAQGGR